MSTARRAAAMFIVLVVCGAGSHRGTFAASDLEMAALPSQRPPIDLPTWGIGSIASSPYPDDATAWTNREDQWWATGTPVTSRCAGERGVPGELFLSAPAADRGIAQAAFFDSRPLPPLDSELAEPLFPFDGSERGATADGELGTGGPATVMPEAGDPTDSLSGLFTYRLQQTGRVIGSDYRHYYSWGTLRDLSLGVVAMAPLANTALDGRVQDWVQEDFRSPGTDSYAAFWEVFGKGKFVISGFAGLAVVGSVLEEWAILGPRGLGVVSDYAWRTTRGYLVGAPPVPLLQFLTGGSRPGECRAGSSWKPFDDVNGASGHAFVGAVPFLTAARMVDQPLLKCGLYVLSTQTAWSRVNDNDHYLSQACLGWWLAYLACRAVDQTAVEDRASALIPLVSPECSGVALIWRR